MQLDGLEAAQQPRCRDCAVVMRAIDRGFWCPLCRHVEIYDDETPLPAAFIGASIHGG